MVLINKFILFFRRSSTAQCGRLEILVYGISFEIQATVCIRISLFERLQFFKTIKTTKSAPSPSYAPENI